MSDSAGQLLTAVQELLKADTAIQALVGAAPNTRVYGAVPDKPTFPFIRLTCSSEPWSTQTFAGMRHILRVQAFDNASGKPGIALSIRAAVYDALNRKEDSIALTDGQQLIQIDHDGVADCFLEQDGKTFQSVIEFQCSIQ